jgi:hypothetical protein
MSLRKRLELALARETYLMLSLSQVASETLDNSDVGRAWTVARMAGRMINPDRSVSIDYLDTLERLVDAGRSAMAPAHEQICRELLRKYGTDSVAAFRALIGRGANPIWIITNCLPGLNRAEGKRETPRSDQRRRLRGDRAKLRRQLQRLATQLTRLAQSFAATNTAARTIGVTGLRDADAQFLHEQGRSVAAVALTMGRRSSSVSVATNEFLKLTEHVFHTTGGYYDREVCDFLDAIQHGGKNWVVEDLQQRRNQEKKRLVKTKDQPRYEFFAEWVADEMAKRM